jgi:hypothetical protein
METQMSDADDWDHVILQARPLTPQRWDVIKRAALRRASEARVEAVRAMLGMLGLHCGRSAGRGSLARRPPR